MPDAETEEWEDSHTGNDNNLVAESTLNQHDELPGSFDSQYISELHSRRDPVPELTGWPMSFLLYATSTFKASDEQDKLFALLGIADDGADDAFKPDYSKPLNEVLLAYALAFAKKGKLAMLLRDAGISRQVDGCPTWVPHITNSDIDNGRLPMHGLLTPTNVLLAEATFFDLIYLDAIEPARPAGPFRGEAFDLFLHIVCRVIYLSPLLESSGHKLEALWRTLIANQNEFGKEAGPEYGEELEEFTRKVLSSPAAGQTYQEWMRCLLDSAPVKFIKAMEQMTLKRKLCYTEKGYFGMVPSSTKMGDKIFVLHGGDVPFVLRGSGKKGEYQLVGDAYVHRIMNGEALKDGKSEMIEIH
ncbi:hypothetical protein K402DRAFT_438381 [Aulographum hederae CBS 113979]|uniref:Uncharacterized protein n=1 Tax=Aulographum hederae CBS 113979 TaxID=1176131 RepID=A0A6G1HC42_9PEZI|nr:hypothetical protein K402DRAFT_438381 [Aulographum hederae CBS 113979]